MARILIKDIQIVNEDRIFNSDILFSQGRIEKIALGINPQGISLKLMVPENTFFRE